MGIFGKIWRYRSLLRYLLHSLYFNFRHLPFHQAFHLPILLYKPYFVNLSGNIIIDSDVKFGMIRLGEFNTCLFPNSGITIENRGKIIFKGRAQIGNDSVISIGKKGVLTLGDNFIATTHFKLVCHYSVIFGTNTLIGWNNLVSDIDFHFLTNIETGKKTKPYGPIYVGTNVWIANGCKLYKNTSIPDYCVIGADTILHSPIECPPYSTIHSKFEKIIRTNGYYLNFKDNLVTNIEPNNP